MFADLFRTHRNVNECMSCGVCNFLLCSLSLSLGCWSKMYFSRNKTVHVLHSVVGCNLMSSVWSVPYSVIAVVPASLLFIITNRCFLQGTWLATWFIGRRIWVLAVQPLRFLLQTLLPMRRGLPHSWTGTKSKSSSLKNSMQTNLKLPSSKCKLCTLPVGLLPKMYILS